jgi:hypothetical protein
MNKKIKLSHLMNNNIQLYSQNYDKTNKFIAISSIYNYFNDDPIIDYLNKFGSIKGYIKDKNEYNFKNFIMNLGIKYENKVVNKIIEKLKETSSVNSEEYKIVKDKNYQRFDKSLELTLKYLEEKIPVIFQAYLYNKELNIHGYVDILCRVDYIDKLFNIKNDEENNIINYLKNNKIEYIPIDIKLSKFEDEFKIENSYNQYIYIQIKSYLDMINKIYNTKNKYCFVIGKQDINNEKIKLLDIKIKHKYNYIDNNLNKALEWITTINNNNNNECLEWKLDKPNRKELYPNMKNTNDYPWRTVKKMLSNINNEITNIYYMGIDKRNILFENNIYSYKDDLFIDKLKLCFSEKTQTYNIIKNMIKCYKNNENYMKVTKIQHSSLDLDNIKEDKLMKKYIYIDIETVYNHYKYIDNKYNYIKDELITQIGIGYLNNNKEWKYISFQINKIDQDEEKDIITLFRNYINTMFDIYDDICFVYYTKAENKIFKEILVDNLLSKDNLYVYKNGESYQDFLKRKMEKNISYIDLHEVFIKREIYIRRLFNFKLKEIVKSLNREGFIELKYDHLKIKDGLSAMTVYLNSPNGINDNEKKILREYNEVDCRALYELHKFLNK